MPTLSDPERRVLGALPAYRTIAAFDQLDAERADNGLEGRYPRDWSLEELEEILEKDPFAPFGAGDATEIESVLEDLEAQGHTKHSGGRWAMTTKGLSALMGEEN